MIGLGVPAAELHALLVRELEVVTETEFEHAARMAARQGAPLERALIERTGMPLGFLLKQLAEAWKVGFIDLKASDVDPAAMRLIPDDFARSHTVLAFRRSDDALDVAMRDPRDPQLLDSLAFTTGLAIQPYLAPEIAIRRAQLLYRGDLRDLLARAAAEDGGDVRVLERPAADERSAVDLLQRIIEFAAVSRASDVHVEPYELQTIVRCRIDGLLRDVLALPPPWLASLVTRVKMLSGMRIDERRLPQDGQFTTDLGGFDLDFRVSSLPTVWGEKIVLRVHSREIVLQDLEDLGLSARDHETLLRQIRTPFGMVLMTGPTASGKSTSLYAMLMRIGAERRNTVNISTVEDPVEFHLPRVSQVQVNPVAGIEFSSALRSLLRQDPDVIMIGEIRDRDTADLAVRAALVGRLMLSTLHTNDAPGAIPRLLDIGVEPFLLASTLSLVVAQRLVRRICVTCRESVPTDPAVLRMLRARPDFDQTVAVLQAEGVLGTEADPFAGLPMYRGRGCVQCGGSGYRRRLGVFEVLEVDDAIREMIRDRSDVAPIRRAAIANGMKTIFQDGLAKVFLGETTLSEVIRVAL